MCFPYVYTRHSLASPHWSWRILVNSICSSAVHGPSWVDDTTCSNSESRCSMACRDRFSWRTDGGRETAWMVLVQWMNWTKAVIWARILPQVPSEQTPSEILLVVVKIRDLLMEINDTKLYRRKLWARIKEYWWVEITQPSSVYLCWFEMKLV